ncbi:MAG: hypothetical protein ACYC77_10725 [Coriobacteriia bacterium]
MKKIMITLVLAMMLVLAFSGTALAKGYSPGNRSSSFLDKGESYVTWEDAQSQMTTAGVSAANRASVHGNYSTTTVKCQVCHSAHKAAASGNTLLQSTAAQACVPCHLGATASSSTKVSAGNRHGGTEQCTNGYCHSISPHGSGDISKYATLKSAMLTDHADSLLDAAILSGSTSLPQKGNIFATGSDASLASSVIATMTVFNPGVTAAILNDVTDAGTIAYGRAIGTGYVCSNGGCHINGAFNSTVESATLGVWEGPVVVDAPGYSVTLADSSVATLPAGTYAATDTFSGELVWDLLHMRDGAIKGHTLAAVADLAVRDVAFANVGACKTCHDSIDYRISATTKQFPHGNDRIATDGTKLTGKTNAWFTVSSYLGSADSTLTLRATGSAYTSASDGACLKCHRNGTNGVGINY